MPTRDTRSRANSSLRLGVWCADELVRIQPFEPRYSALFQRMPPKSKDTELAEGDLLVWKTHHASVALWVIGILQQGRGKVPLVELLDWQGTELPPKPESLSAATRAVHHGVMHPFVWFLPIDLVTLLDPKGAYHRVRSGFMRAGFTPSRSSQYGLGAAIVRRHELERDLTAFAKSKTTEGTAETARAKAADERAANKRAAARDAAKEFSAKLAAVVVKPRVMAKPHPMARAEVLSLTGKDSHTVWFAPGIGNMYVGPTPPGRQTPQAIVIADARLNWDALDGLRKTGAGYAMPRWLRYEGTDPAIFAWLSRRAERLERLDFRPMGAMTADASEANLNELSIDASGTAQSVKLTLPKKIGLTVDGEAKDLVLDAPEGGKEGGSAEESYLMSSDFRSSDLPVNILSVNERAAP